MNPSGDDKKDGAEKTPDKRTNARWELISAVLLGLATVATSWVGYQAALWSGTQATLYSQANSLRAEANRESTTAAQTMAFDTTMFANWINARREGNKELEEFYRNHFRPELIPSFEAWLAVDPTMKSKLRSNPFLLSNYMESLFGKSYQLEAQAEQTFKKGHAAKRNGDHYVLLTVIFSSVLFFAGIALQFDHLPLRAGVLILSAVMFAWGILKLMSLPLAS